jgi:hypothetical protein
VPPKKDEVLKTSGKNYKIVYDGISDYDSHKFVPELKTDKNAPVPGDERKDGDEHKKKAIAEPDAKDQKKLKQNKEESPSGFKIEVDTMDDAAVAEHIKSDPKKER